MWETYKKGFKAYLQLEKSLATNSIEAYLRDVEMLTQYMQIKQQLQTPAAITMKDLQAFLQWLGSLGMTATSQARIVSGLRQFFKYCLLHFQNF